MNYGVRRPGRAASLTLLDRFSRSRDPARTLLVSTGLFMPVPEAVRRRVFSWISAGAEADDSLPEAALICAGSTDYVMRKAMPKSFTDHQLRSLDCPLLALRWVRSGMTWMEHESTIRSSSSRAPQPDGQQIAANARMVEQGERQPSSGQFGE